MRRMAKAWLLLFLWGATMTVTGGAAAAPEGRTYGYRYDGKKDGHRKRAWWGRAYLPDAAVGAEKPLPMVVFLHGLNKQLIKYRWMGGGSEGDVRTIIGDMVEDGRLPPLIVAGPSSITKSEVSRGSSWNHFDLDNFIDRTIARLDGIAKVDDRRIIVAGHSGAGCSLDGGVATASRFRRELLAIVAIDTCMSEALAKRLTETTAKNTHLIVGYQTLAWERSFDAFVRRFERGVKLHPPTDEVMRILDHQKPETAYHDETVPITFERWLPRLLPLDGAP